MKGGPKEEGRCHETAKIGELVFSRWEAERGGRLACTMDVGKQRGKPRRINRKGLRLLKLCLDKVLLYDTSWALSEVLPASSPAGVH